MKPPIPWTSDAHPPDVPPQRAASLLRAAGEVEPWTDARQQQVLRNVRAALSRPAWLDAGRRLALPLAAAACAAAMVSFAWRAKAPKTERVEATQWGTIAPSPNADYQTDARQRLALRRGHLAVRPTDPRRPVLLDTPHLKATVEAIFFRVQVAADVTTFWLDDGQAWLRGAGGDVVYLTSGEIIRSDDPRLAAAAKPAPIPAPDPRVEAVGSCARASTLVARKSCYLLLAMSDDLAAQNALYALGLIDRDEVHDGPSAIEYWRAYERRFPKGALNQESSIAVLSELLAEHRNDEALSEADAFLSRFPGESRADEVRLIHANLSCGRDAAAALATYEALLRRSLAPSLREDVMFNEASCAAANGRTEQARAAWRAYVTAFPQGAHAAEVKKHLAE